MSRATIPTGTLLLAVIAGCAGCSTAGERTAGPTRPPGEPRDVDAELLAQIERTAADLRSLSETPDGSPASSGEPVVASAAAPPRANLSPAVEIESAEPPAPEQASTPDPEPEPEPDPAPETSPTAGELARRLALALRRDAEIDPVRVYAALAALELIEPGVMVNPSAIAGLTPEDARILESWADLMREADARLSSSPADARGLVAALLDAAEEADAIEPLEIRTARLCSRVEGFGRYTPMGATWLAGRPHKALVYAEVDRFASTPAVGPRGQRGFEARLTQELQLFHDADGLLAWRLPPQDVVDFSRNRRRDFFIVQMIDLPQSLSVGRYQLKVAIRDEATRQTAETVIPITIVADRTLVGPAPD